MDDNPYDTGMGTSLMMWEMVSELLSGEKLPRPVVKAIYALCKGEAKIIRKEE